MVSPAQDPQQLSALQESLSVDWGRIPDPLRRLALLRRHFRLLHELLNEELASSAPDPGLPKLRSIHDAFAAFPTSHASTSTEDLKRLLLLPEPKLEGATGNHPVHPVGLPEFLSRPGREWEVLLYRFAPHCEWSASRREILLQEPGAIQDLIRRERQSVEQGSLMLGLEKSPNGPHLWWMHELLAPGAARPGAPFPEGACR